MLICHDPQPKMELVDSAQNIKLIHVLTRPGQFLLMMKFDNLS